jgi:hypothetical protein
MEADQSRAVQFDVSHYGNFKFELSDASRPEGAMKI